MSYVKILAWFIVVVSLSAVIMMGFGAVECLRLLGETARRMTGVRRLDDKNDAEGKTENESN